MQYIFRFATLFFMLLANIALWSQISRVCGYVLDKNTLEPLIGASVIIKGSRGIASDKNGFFCINVDAGKPVQIKSSYVGYKTGILETVFKTDTTLQLLLIPGLSLSDVTVTAPLNKRADIINISISSLKSIPSLTGEPDILKAIQMLPGIQAGREGTSDLYVRGGEKDENLYLLDDVPLYYVNHIGGFMSVFDVNIVKNINIYKGVIPARFGGRLSSAIDVKLKDGDASQKKGEFMLGILASKVYLEGPIKKSQKTKYLISLRRCNIDLLTRPFSLMTSNGDEMFAYTFYDATTKITHTFNLKSKVTALVYFGRDKLYWRQKSISTTGEDNNINTVKSKTNWGNRVFSLKWNYLFNNNVFNETRFTINRFFNANKSIIKNGEFEEETVFRSSINDYSLQNQFKIINAKTKFYVGVGINLHNFKPTVSSSSTKGSKEQESDKFKVSRMVSEFYAYSDFRWDISSRLTFNPGLRLVYWSHINRLSIDPKLSLNYSVINNLYLNVGYSYNHQYIHLLSGTDGGISSELWIPSSEDLPPKTAEQVSLGAIFTSNKYSFSIEAFRKNWNNLVVFNPTLSLKDASNWDKMVESGGTGQMNGIEMLASKNRGKLTYSIAYTLSKNTRTFLQLNRGRVFPFKYDRRHELSTYFAYNFSKSKKIAITWIFNSGTPVTVPTQWYPAISHNGNGQTSNNKEDVLDFVHAHYYSSLNNYRTEPYHRLDIGYSRSKMRGKTERVLYLGIYNIYNNLNTFYTFIRIKDNKLKLYKYTLFPFMPSISYTVKF